MSRDYWRDEPTCPHCGEAVTEYEVEDLWPLHETVIDCAGCGREVRVETKIEAKYHVDVAAPDKEEEEEE